MKESGGAGSRSQESTELDAASRGLSAPIPIPNEPMQALPVSASGLSGPLGRSVGSIGSMVIDAAERALAALRTGDVTRAEVEVTLILRLCSLAGTSE